MSMALLVVDVQKEFFNNDKYRPIIEPTLEYINEAADFFRQAGHPVVFIQDEEAGEGPGSEGYELVDELIIKEGDHRLSKVYSNSFMKTGLYDLLKSRGIKFVVVAGFAAEYCVLFTLNGALERDFEASLLQHGVSGETLDRVNDTYLVRPTISLNAIYYICKEHGKDG